MEFFLATDGTDSTDNFLMTEGSKYQDFLMHTDNELVTFISEGNKSVLISYCIFFICVICVICVICGCILLLYLSVALFKKLPNLSTQSLQINLINLIKIIQHITVYIQNGYNVIFSIKQRNHNLRT